MDRIAKRETSNCLFQILLFLLLALFWPPPCFFLLSLLSPSSLARVAIIESNGVEEEAAIVGAALGIPLSVFSAVHTSSRRRQSLVIVDSSASSLNKEFYHLARCVIAEVGVRETWFQNKTVTGHICSAGPQLGCPDLVKGVS